MNKIVRAAMIAACAAFASPTVAQAQSANAAEYFGQQKVVYHFNGNGGEGNKAYKGGLRNLQNHINAVGAEHLEAAVVMHGNGLGMLPEAMNDQDLQGAVASLKGQGVKFLVCANTLKGRNIDYEKDLYDVWDSDIVPSGVAELSRLQQMGYTYVKP